MKPLISGALNRFYLALRDKNKLHILKDIYVYKKKDHVNVGLNTVMFLLLYILLAWLDIGKYKQKILE